MNNYLMFNRLLKCKYSSNYWCLRILYYTKIGVIMPGTVILLDQLPFIKNTHLLFAGEFMESSKVHEDTFNGCNRRFSKPKSHLYAKQRHNNPMSSEIIF